MHFKGNNLSPLLFVPLTQILRRIESVYTLKNGEKLNHLLFIDNLNVFGKSERKVNGLVSNAQISSKDIGIEFGRKKYGKLILKRGQVVSSEGVEISDGATIKK